MGLAEVFASIATPDVGLRTGVIKKFVGNKVIVDMSGAEVNAAVCEPYSPAIGETVAILRSDSTYLILGRPTGAASGVPASGTLLPGGKVYTTTNVKLAGFSGEAAVTDYSITVTAPNASLVHMYASFGYSSDNTGDRIIMRIRRDSTIGVEIGRSRFQMLTANEVFPGYVEAWFKGDGVQHTFFLTAQRVGSFTDSITVDSGFPSVFLAHKAGLYSALTAV